MTEITLDVVINCIIPLVPVEFIGVNKKFYSFALDFIIKNNIYDNSRLLVEYTKSKNILIIQKILEQPDVHPSACNNKALKKAIEQNFLEGIEVILKHPRFDPLIKIHNYPEPLFVLEFAASHEARIFKYLLDSGLFDPSADHNGVIRLAYCYKDVLQLLLNDPRVDPSTPIDDIEPFFNDHRRENEPLFFACSMGFVEQVKLLLADGRVDPRRTYPPCILPAAANRQAQVVRLLLADGRIDPSNLSLLDIACRNGDAATVQVLLDDPRVSVNCEDGVLLYVCEAKFVNVLQLLVTRPELDITAVLLHLHTFNDQIREILEDFVIRRAK